MKKIKNIFSSYKTIIIISFLINIILIAFAYYLLFSNKIYVFNGKGDYVEENNGLIVINNDINLINGSNLKYINSSDYDITSYKIGYYTMKDKKLSEIVSTSQELESPIKFSEIIENFTSLNVTEKNSTNIHFTHTIKQQLNDGLYLVIEAKTSDNEELVDNITLNITKISKY